MDLKKWLAKYDLEFNPFEIVLPSRNCYVSEEQTDLDVLFGLVNEGKNVLLSGPFGVGKTTTLKYIAKYILPEGGRKGVMCGRRPSPYSFSRNALIELGHEKVERSGSVALNLLKKELDNNKVSFLVDEFTDAVPNMYGVYCELMDHENANFVFSCTDTQYVFFKEMLKRPSVGLRPYHNTLLALDHRVSYEFDLSPMKSANTIKRYIHSRLGKGRDIILDKKKIWELILEKSDGNPRLVNDIMTSALLLGSIKKQVIDLEVVEDAIVRTRGE